MNFYLFYVPNSFVTKLRKNKTIFSVKYVESVQKITIVPFFFEIALVKQDMFVL